ncbi:hypothetical protein BG006_010559 [Podila minutissima]|uniref:AB hydrolase-1 domain-containing protein n=1 Tax=Podila minutissima TaxID=64525 RepID=A0A9P5VIP3_9FUNG|nr:hypothetical protein BG006_010559 [Podila minutissima]
MASDQLTPGSFNHKYATIGKYQYHYVEEGNPSGLPVVLVHGFPDLWFGWRHQIRFLASQRGPQGQGYRVIAVDLLGYGATSKPQSEDSSGDAHPDYSPKTVAGHVVALMDQLGIAKAVLAGHDWGVGNPQRPVTKDFISLEKLEKENQMFSYFKYFASAQAVHDMDTGMDDYIGAVFCDSTGNTEEDRKYYIDNLRPEGFHGPLSYYRTFRMSHQEDLPMVGKRYTIPTLLMVVIEDLILVPEYVRSVNLDYVDKLEYLDIENGGHFVLTENPDAVNQGIKNYIEKLFAAGEIAKENEKVAAEVAKEEMKEEKEEKEGELEEELEEEKEVRNREQAIEVLELNDAPGAEGPSYSSSCRVKSIKHFSHGHEHGPVLLESGERSKKAKL